MFRSLSLTDVFRDHRNKFLPIDDDDRERLTVRRNHILQDTLHALHAGITLKKHLKVKFVGEPAVDAGGPLCGSFFTISCVKLLKKTHYFVV